MYKGELLGKRLDIGVQDDKRHQLNCHHVIQVNCELTSYQYDKDNSLIISLIFKFRYFPSFQAKTGQVSASMSLASAIVILR